MENVNLSVTNARVICPQWDACLILHISFAACQFQRIISANSHVFIRVSLGERKNRHICLLIECPSQGNPPPPTSFIFHALPREDVFQRLVTWYWRKCPPNLFRTNVVNGICQGPAMFALRMLTCGGRCSGDALVKICHFNEFQTSFDQPQNICTAWGST